MKNLVKSIAALSFFLILGLSVQAQQRTVKIMMPPAYKGKELKVVAQGQKSPVFQLKIDGVAQAGKYKGFTRFVTKLPQGDKALAQGIRTGKTYRVIKGSVNPAQINPVMPKGLWTFSRADNTAAQPKKFLRFAKVKR